MELARVSDGVMRKFGARGGTSSEEVGARWFVQMVRVRWVRWVSRVDGIVCHGKSSLGKGGGGGGGVVSRC